MILFYFFKRSSKIIFTFNFWNYYLTTRNTQLKFNAQKIFKKACFFQATIFCKMKKVSKRSLNKIGLCVAFIMGLVYSSGLYQYIIAQPLSTSNIPWALKTPLKTLMTQLQKRNQPDEEPVNRFVHPFLFTFGEKCHSERPIALLLVVKSAIGNFDCRKAIRASWGTENDNFSSEGILRTVFLLGYDFAQPDLQAEVEWEANAHQDVIQGQFQDYYYNNILKTMMGIHWAFHNCPKVKYFLFIDDDYYFSPKNLLHFLRNFSNYRGCSLNAYSDSCHLFAGHVFKNSVPIRWYFNKWHVSIDEYPYSQYPPYITGGAYVLSRISLVHIYYATLYVMPFKFDDIFLGMAAIVAEIKLWHEPRFYLHEKKYSLNGYKMVIASHGFKDSKKLVRIWNEQKAVGHV